MERLQPKRKSLGAEMMERNEEGQKIYRRENTVDKTKSNEVV